MAERGRGEEAAARARSAAGEEKPSARGGGNDDAAVGAGFCTAEEAEGAGGQGHGDGKLGLAAWAGVAGPVRSLLRQLATLTQ
jgi:hypothetical protein